MIRALALALLLTACATEYTPWELADMQGIYKVPDQCKRDLSYVDWQVAYVPLSLIRRVTGNARAMGYTNFNARQIFVGRELNEWERIGTLHHERCHAIAGAWHP